MLTETDKAKLVQGAASIQQQRGGEVPRDECEAFVRLFAGLIGKKAYHPDHSVASYDYENGKRVFTDTEAELIEGALTECWLVLQDDLAEIADEEVNKK